MEVDGSFGEGGGQILRTAVSFSMVLGVPIHVTKIRAGRKIPGLRPQHSATMKILGEICSAKVEGASVGSTELSFSPGEVETSRGSFNLGTAASIPLVLQAVIPAVSLMGNSYDLELVGGTDVPWSPTSDYIDRVVAPAMRAVGIGFTFRVDKRGYYPNGGGRASVHIDPCERVAALQLASARREGEGMRPSLVSRCGDLPVSVAERQAKAAVSLLRARGVEVAQNQVRLEDSVSPGSSVLVSVAGAGCYLGGDSIGERGKPAETVGREASESFLTSFLTGARADVHLADMLAPVLCLSDSPSALLIPYVTEHLRTSLHVAGQFTSADHRFEDRGRAALLSISPARAK
ncbi:MAG TPA: RNA 3'-terminal phosphate cyclase [Nitrososphaerales archaeon]|nr:RNA 3'-terminal phosphate cyclase [Nitrososphaerales archaeon]